MINGEIGNKERRGDEKLMMLIRVAPESQAGPDIFLSAIEGSTIPRDSALPFLPFCQT